MQAHNLFLLTRTHQLVAHRAPRVRIHDRIVRRRKARVVALHIVLAILLARLRLRQANRAHLRMGKHDAGDVGVVELRVRLAAKQAVGEATTGGDGDGGELKAAIAHVTQGEDVVDVGVLVLVDGDVTLGIGLHARRVEAEVFGLGVAADGPEEAVDLERALALGVGVGELLPAVAGVRHGLLRGARVDVHPLPFVLGQDLVLDHGVEGAEELVLADEEVGFGPERVEHARHFDGDVACAHNGDALRLCLELEKAIRGDAELGAGDAGEGGVAADGDEDLFRIDRL